MRTATMIAWLCAAHAAIAADTASEGMEVGGRAMISGVRFACGPWKAIRNSGCPAALQGSSPKIAVYTPVLNKNLWKLAAAIEREIQADDTLKYSFIEVIDATDPKDLTIVVQ